MIDMAGFSFILTERCNWDCEYCKFPMMKTPTDTTINILRKHLPYIKKIIDTLKPDVFIDVQGGEVGLLSPDVIAYLLSTIDIPVDISTNGAFLEREYHVRPDIRPYIRRITYHVDQSPHQNLVVDYHDKDISISRGIVHNNIEEMATFIRNNEHITFDFIEMEYDIRKQRTTNVDDYRHLQLVLQSLGNITDNAHKRIEDRINEQPGMRDKCKGFHNSISMDMVNETIILCQRVPEISIPLTKKNLIKRISNYPKDVFEGTDIACESCTRLYFDKSPRTIADTLLLRRKFK